VRASSFGSTLSQRENYKWWVFGCVVLGTFLTVVDLNTLNVALPTIGTRFGANLSSLQWVILANALTVTVLLLPMGRFGDMIGRKSMYMMGITVFFLGAVLAGFSVSLTMLILSRVVQGVGGAMVQSNSMAMSLSVFPPTERGKVIGLNMSVVGLAGIAGPVIGGLLVTAFGWRSIFVITGGVALFSLAVAATVLDGRRFVSQAPDGTRKRFDWLGAALSGVALLLFLLVMTNGYRLGWLSPLIILGALAVAGSATAFIWWQLRNPDPLFELRLFKRRVFALAAAASFTTHLGTASVMFLMPLLLQGVLGHSPRDVGLILLPSAVCVALIAPVAGRLSDRFGWRLFTVGGLILSIAAAVTFSTTLSVTMSIGLIIPVLVIRIIGLSFFNPTNTSSLFSAVEQSRYGAVSALTQVFRNSGSVTGIAIVTMVIVATMSSMGFEPSLDAVSSGDGAVAQAFITGARRAFLVLTGLFVMALVFSLAKGGKVAPPGPEVDGQPGEEPQVVK
jgi:EmrB/QacA subfamily drug resistance transporter